MGTPPLDGLRVLVTRPGCHPSDKWSRALAAAGAIVLPYPTIQVVPPPSWQALDEALGRLARYHWIVFTSASSVSFTLSRLPQGQRPLQAAKVAAVGAETARALGQAQVQVDLVPAEQRQEGLVKAFGGLHPGTRLLFPRALEGQETLPQALRNQGCQVDVVAAYQTVPVDPLPTLPAFDAAIFASPSALRAFVEQKGTQELADRTVAVIGPTTADQAILCGLVPCVAEQPNIEALISAIVRERLSKGGS